MKLRKAIEYMKNETEKQERRKRLKNASLRVRKEGMKVNVEFSEIEHGSELRNGVMHHAASKPI